MATISKEAQLQARIAELEAQLKKRQTMSCKVSTARAVSVYGLGRFPVTLYASQWARLQGFMPTIAEFIEEHGAELSEGKDKDGNVLNADGEVILTKAQLAKAQADAKAA